MLLKIFCLGFLFLVSLHFVSFAQTFQDFLNQVNASPETLRTALVDSFMNTVGNLPLKEQDTLCYFIYRGNATSVTTTGDANGWDIAAFPLARLSTTNLWYFTKVFETDARLDYKFVLNGSTWILDPRNPYTVTGGYGPNSELRMPAYVLPPEISYYSDIPHGTLWDTSFFSVNLGNTRTILVYTPPNYLSSTDSFPVILFHDGLEYVTLAKANNVIDYLIYHNRIRPIIAVFVPPVNRTAEYAGNQMSSLSAFIVNEIIPYLDARFRTRQEPSARATLGASNGGNIALWLGLNYSNVFGNIAAQSSNIVGAISTGFQNNPLLDLKLYLDLGTYDISQLIPLVRNFVNIIQAKDYEYQYFEYHEGHSWGNWRAHIDNALEMFFPPTPSYVDNKSVAPYQFKIEQNYPNPFNPHTIINYQLPADADVLLKVYNVLGEEVAVLVNEFQSAEGGAGLKSVKWDASEVPSGVYYYRLSASVTSLGTVQRFTDVKMLLLIK